MEMIAENLWLLSYPLTIAGFDARRNVSVIRLSSGDLVVHSTAPFSADDVARIRERGAPRWILDAMLDHDSFSAQGREAFPSIPFLGPEGFEDNVAFPVRSLLPPPVEWGDELQVIKLEGAPSFGEHVFFHAPSQTLIVCDLLFNFPQTSSLWQSALLRLAVGPRRDPGVSRRLRFAIRDRAALRGSVEKMLAWDFKRIVVGHGEPVTTDAKARARTALQRAKLA